VTVADKAHAFSIEDAPNYQAHVAGSRCIECRWSSGGYAPDSPDTGCRLYMFTAAQGYKPSFGCDSYQPDPHMYKEATAPLSMAEDDDDGPKWVEMLRTGVHKSRFIGGGSASGHTVAVFDKGDLDSAARGFAIAKAEGHLLEGQAPVGYDHGEFGQALRLVKGEEPADGELAGAAAWFSDVKVVANDDDGYSLMGLHHFTDDGRDRVRAGALRGYSIDIAPPGLMQRTDGSAIDDWVPFGGTLTNKPFIRGMAPVAATETVPVPHKTEVPQMDITNLRGLLALSEDATEGQALIAIQALSDKAAKSDVLAAEVKALTEERDAKTAELVALTERSDSLTVTQAIHDGRIAKAQGERYLRVLTALGEEEAHAIFPANKHATRSLVDAGTPERKSDGAVTEDTVFDDCVALREQLVKDLSISPADAWVRALDQIAKDPTKAPFINNTAAEA